MTNIIQELENKIENLGLTIGEKKQDDFIYIITVPHKRNGDWVIYTTQKAIQHEGKSCFRLYLLQNHIPFEEVTKEKIEQFIWHYESFCLMMDLPVVCLKPESKDIFIHTYLDIVKKSNERLDTYKYNAKGISIDEIANRIMLA